MKKLITIIVFAAVLLSCSDISCFAYSAECAVLMEAESGDIIYSENPDTRRGPASTTKIMTAIIAIENCPLDKVITVSPAAVGVEGSSVYL
ncbi:MAG: hypothetical protein KBS59_00160 [Clostridiales bacterium]|nr:hypothetical protein [Clostridiales bacterium]